MKNRKHKRTLTPKRKFGSIRGVAVYEEYMLRIQDEENKKLKGLK